MLTLAGETECRGARQGDPRFRRRASPRCSWTRAESRDATKTYNKMTLAELAQARAGLRFREPCSRPSARNVDSVLVAQPSAFTGDCGADRQQRRWRCFKDQLLVRSLDAYAAYPAASVRPREFRLLRHRPERHAAAGAALEARRSNFTVGTLGDDVSKLYVAQLLPAGDQGGRRPARPQHHRRDGPAHRQARLDGAGDQGEGARQARRLHAEDRLSVAVARHERPRDQARRPARQRDARRPSSSTTINSASSAARSAAGNGA